VGLDILMDKVRPVVQPNRILNDFWRRLVRESIFVCWSNLSFDEMLAIDPAARHFS
jgi:hypothetical protein